AFLAVGACVHRELAPDVALDDGLAAEPGIRGQVPGGIQPIGLVVFHLAQVLSALSDDDVAGRAGAVAAARVLEAEIEVLRDVEKRLRLSVIRVRELAGLEFDRLLLAVDDDGVLGHTHYISFTRRPDSAACTERFILTSAGCRVASFSW